MYTFHNICRTCSCQGELQSLFDADPLILSNMLAEIVDIKVVKGDKYPQNICSFCVDKLKNAYLFKKQCQAIQIKLELYLQSVADTSTYEVVYKEEIVHSTPESTNDKIETTSTALDDDSKPPIEPESILKVEDGSSNSCDWNVDNLEDDYLDEENQPSPSIEPDINTLPPPEMNKKKPKNRNRKDGIRQKRSFRKRVECDQCHKKVIDMDLHMKIHLNLPCTCKICGAEVARKSFARHLRSHTEFRPHQCDQCGRSFRDNCTLRSHMRVHTGERPFKCTECDKTFKRRFQLTNHAEDHKQKEIKEENKEKEVKPPVKVEVVEKEVPREIADIDCNQCDEKFRSKLGLLRHLNLAHGIGKKTCLCNYCGQMLASKKSLNNHQLHCKVKKENDELKPDEYQNWICETCDKKCISKESLSLHRAVHRKKLHLCIQCGKLFSSKLTLKGHQMIHSGDKPYKCTICDQSFRHKQHLSNHRRTHTGEKPFKCMECDKSYTEKKSLTVHMRIHTGEIPYSCSICNTGFNDLSNFKRHCVSHKANEGKEPKKLKNNQKVHNFSLPNIDFNAHESGHL